MSVVVVRAWWAGGKHQTVGLESVRLHLTFFVAVFLFSSPL